MERITKKQLRAIWALAHRTGLNEEDLHVRTKLFFGKNSIRSLTKQEASRVIEYLLHKGETTRAQITLIKILTAQMGWSRQHLNGLAQKMYGKRELGDLNVRQASGLIEALKAIKVRHVKGRAA